MKRHHQAHRASRTKISAALLAAGQGLVPAPTVARAENLAGSQGSSAAPTNTPVTFRELEAKYMFGFTTGADIGPEGERAIKFAPNLEFRGEFESKTLRVEKVVAGNAEITLKLRPLVPGRYCFYGDFNEATADGAIIVD